MTLKPGLDYRKPETRRDLFQRFYSFHLRTRSHPGCVYYVLPHLADTFGWDEEQRAWAAWINGSTQNPVTTMLLMEQGDRPEKADKMLNWYSEHINELAWDTDRRYHRKAFLEATLGYLHATEGRQGAFWRKASRGGWNGVWNKARALPTLGRLSAWSYLEYLRLLEVGNVPDADTLMIRDLSGSRSHRNGLLLVEDRRDQMFWKRNPGFDGKYTPGDYRRIEAFGESLLDEARKLNPGNPHVGYLTMESALCTFKSWHVPNRRYTGVYNDMLYDRLRQAEARHGKRFGAIWDSRKILPDYLRMEKTPLDPGCVPAKQNHFLETGEPVIIGREFPEIGLSSFDRKIMSGKKIADRKWK